MGFPLCAPERAAPISASRSCSPLMRLLETGVPTTKSVRITLANFLRLAWARWRGTFATFRRSRADFVARTSPYPSTQSIPTGSSELGPAEARGPRRKRGAFDINSLRWTPVCTIHIHIHIRNEKERTRHHAPQPLDWLHTEL